MATERRIEISFDTDGSSSIEGFGFPDGSCLTETASLEKALAGEAAVEERKLKPEAYQKAGEKVQQKLGGSGKK